MSSGAENYLDKADQIAAKADPYREADAAPHLIAEAQVAALSAIAAAIDRLAAAVEATTS